MKNKNQKTEWKHYMLELQHIYLTSNVEIKCRICGLSGLSK